MKNSIYFFVGSRFNNFLFSIMMLASAYSYAQDPVCATPGADGVQEFPAPQNSFFPGAGDNISVGTGDTSFVLEGIPDPFVVGGVLYGFGNNEISKGDLLLVIQIQGASINTTNTAAYGSGNTANNGSGYLDLNNVGQYEYLVALNDVPSTGGELKFRASGANGGLLHFYENKPADAGNGVKRFQVIRLMQYSDLTLTADVVTTPWNGKAGGLIAIDVAGTLDFNGKTINASMTGFRGGYMPVRTIQNTNFSDYVTSITGNNSTGTTKGEGIAGTPRYVWDGYDYLDQGASWIGYPGGDYARGAPGNAGGGGNVHNAGGGGGGNGGAGGSGGYGWPLANETPQTNDRNSQASLETGGRPGAAMPSNVSNGLLFMGGGGGGGDANNATTGVRGGVGGGIVIITANKIIGNGTVVANGGRGEAGQEGSSADGAGGGGAGGSVFINVKEPSSGNLFIQAKGGPGGHSFTTTLHGPGGGGGGGIIYYNTNGVNVTTDVSSGASGRINDGEPVNPDNYADFPAGANKTQNGAGHGKLGIVSNFSQNDLPPYLSTSAYCYPELSITKWRGQPQDSIPAGSMVTYEVRIDNNGGGAKGVRIHDALPASFTLVSATIDFDLTTGNPQSLNNTGTPEDPVLGTFDLVTGEGADIEMQVQVPFTTPEGTYHNGIQVGYLDPTREISGPERVIFPPTHALPGQETEYIESDDTVGGSNYHPDQEGEEVVVVKPELIIEKTIDNPCIDPTNGNEYSIRLLNSNPYPYPLIGVEVTDIVHSDLVVTNVSGTGWSSTNTGNTYVLTLDQLPGGTAANPYSSEWINITVEPIANPTQTSWLNTATVPTSKGMASSSVMLYQQPTAATATKVDFPGQTCDNGTYYLEGNEPAVGIGKWEFTNTSTYPQGSAYFENSHQHNTRVFVQPGQTVEVIWTITNSLCGTESSPPLSFTAPVPPTATISGGGPICAGQPYSDAPAITVTLTPPTGNKRIKYIDGAGFERTVVVSEGTYNIPRDYAGTYSLVEIKAGGTGGVNDSSWDMECPGTISGRAQINVISEAPVGGFINYHGGPVCKGEMVPMSLVLTGHIGTVEGWQSSLDGMNWSTIIPGTADLTEYSPAVDEGIYYRAIIRGAEVNGNPCFPDKNSAMVYLTVKDCNDLFIAKTIDNNTPDAGSQITFTITVINEKEQNATGTNVLDKLPNGYTYDSHNAPAGTTYDETTGVWDIGTLNAGDSSALTITAIVNQVGQYTNQAVVFCDEQETDYTNNTATVIPEVNCDVRNVSPKVN